MKLNHGNWGVSIVIEIYMLWSYRARDLKQMYCTIENTIVLTNTNFQVKWKKCYENRTIFLHKEVF